MASNSIIADRNSILSCIEQAHQFFSGQGFLNLAFDTVFNSFLFHSIHMDDILICESNHFKGILGSGISNQGAVTSMMI